MHVRENPKTPIKHAMKGEIYGKQRKKYTVKNKIDRKRT